MIVEPLTVVFTIVAYACEVSSVLTYVQYAANLLCSVIVADDKNSVGLTGGDERSIDCMFDHGPCTSSLTSRTATYHVFPGSSPLMFQAVASVFVTVYISGSSVDSQASS